MSEPASPRGPGRPSLYTEELAEEICDRLSSGETLADICRSPHMPAVSTVYDWKRAYPEFSVGFGRARDAGYDEIAARTRRTARGVVDDDGGDSTGDVARDKLIIDLDLKLLAKWDPRRYGDKHVHVGGGPDDEPIHHAFDLSKLADQELDQLEGLLERMNKVAGADEPPAT